MDTITKVSAALRAIDVDAFSNRRAAVDAEIAKVRTARQEGVDQRAEVLRELARRREKKMSGAAAADALLEGGDVMEALESDETLAERRDALTAALDELSVREDRLTAVDRRSIFDDLTKLISPAVAPLAEALRERARAAVNELLAVHADAQALREATHSGAAMALAVDIRGGDPASIVERLAIHFRCTMPEKVAPSPEIVGLLNQHADLIRMAEGRMPRG